MHIISASRQANILVWLILGYLSRYPHAKDTVTGISRWWLLSEGVEADPHAVAIAVDQLAAGGWLRAVPVSMGEPFYALNQDRREILQRFLANPS